MGASKPTIEVISKGLAGGCNDPFSTTDATVSVEHVIQGEDSYSYKVFFVGPHIVSAPLSQRLYLTRSLNTTA